MTLNHSSILSQPLKEHKYHTASLNEHTQLMPVSRGYTHNIIKSCRSSDLSVTRCIRRRGCTEHSSHLGTRISSLAQGKKADSQRLLHDFGTFFMKAAILYITTLIEGLGNALGNCQSL